METINQPALRRKDQDLAAELRLWSRQIRSRIGRSLDDAEAHAVSAITRSVRLAPAGRPTIAEVRQTRGVTAAEARLNELLNGLENLIGQSREAAYRIAAPGWVGSLDPAWQRRGAGQISQAAIDRARSLVVGGMVVRRDLQGSIERARSDLERTLVTAGTPAGPSAPSPDELVTQWATQARRAIEVAALGILEDGFNAIDRLAGRDVIDPNRLHPDPTLD